MLPGRYEVRFGLDRLGIVRGSVDVRPDETSPVELTYRVLTVRGTVRDREGQPIPSATVFVESDGLEDEPGFGVLPDGTFEIFGVPAGPQTLRIRAPGSVPRRMAGCSMSPGCEVSNWYSRMTSVSASVVINHKSFYLQ